MRPDRARQVLAANATNVIYERAVQTLRAKLWRSYTIIWTLTVALFVLAVTFAVHMLEHH